MLLILTAVSVAAQLAVAAPAPAELRREELMAALRSGGYTLLVRHGRTDRSIPNGEKPSYTPPLRADQRNLTADGERDVRLMSEVVRKYAFPIGEVISSPVYRCRETADAFGTPSVTMTLRIFPTTAETAALVAAVPRPGSNRVLVTHHFVIENHVPGIRPGDIGESEAAVVRPTGDGGVTLVGRITLADWEALAGTAAAAPAAPTAAIPDYAPTTPIAVVIPETRAGRLASQYIVAFNSGDAARMRAFIEASLVAAPDRPTETRVQAYIRLFEENGPLVVTSVASSSADKMTLQVRSKQGNVTVSVIAAPEPSDRAQSVSFGIMTGGHR
jgi:phosphohistidine phosphatase SixA